jgi:two-component system NtrC family sensor kinase
MRAARIVKDLLVFSRRQESERREPVQVNDLVRHIVSTRQYAMNTGGIDCRTELADDLPPALADATQIEQVLLNLIVNAEQALETTLDQPRAPGESPVGLLTVRTYAREGWVVIEVADSGPGIPAEHLSRIWDPFWTTKAEGEGTGLGLSVVHGIVTSHGGTIEVESVPGVGTCFTVRLPEADPASRAESGRPDDQPAAAQAEHPLDILVIDDEPAIARFLEQYLSSRGHAVLTASGGAPGLKMAEQMPFDVVVCDLRMPGMDGFEVVRRLRDIPGREPGRVVISTGATIDAAARRRLDALKVAAVVAKPYDIELLRRAVESV